MRSLRDQLYVIIFGTKTKWGRRFDLFLLISITISVILVVIDSVTWINNGYRQELNIAEWFFTILFTLEYILRIYTSPKPWRYVFSFYGLIDFLAIIPTYLTFFFVGPEYLATIRTVRILRIFRVLKLTKYLWEAEELSHALKRSFPKIAVFLGAVFITTVVIGTIMFLLENSNNGFTNIPTSIYWAIVTVTTVGFGDIVPVTFMGRVLASALMILGYGIIAVPTGIVSAEMVHKKKDRNKLICSSCNSEDHESDSSHCRHCGNELENEK